MSSCLDTAPVETKTVVAPVTPQEAAKLKNRDDVMFVDPRPAAGIAKTTGIIPGAHNIALEDISAGNLPQEFADRSIHVITSCQAGPMGAAAAHEFAKIGFTRVNFVDGGTQGWLDAGLPTDR